MFFFCHEVALQNIVLRNKVELQLVRIVVLRSSVIGSSKSFPQLKDKLLLRKN